MRGSIVRLIVSAALVTAVTAPKAEAASIVATLAGHAIPLAQVGRLACHDFDYPIIRCFGSVERLDAAVAARLASGTELVPASATSTGYVVVYENVAYGGANPKTLSANVAWLSDIGWNDKISSFKSFGATGTFYENSPNGGFAYPYGSTTQVSNVGPAYNDKFSAFYIY